MNILSGLTAVFIVLKVCHVIDWNWWIVLTPAIIEVAIILFVIKVGKKVIEVLIED